MSGEIIGQSAAVSAGTDGEPMRPRTVANQFVDPTLLLHDQVVGDQAAVAAPGHRFGAHHGGPRAAGGCEQLADAFAKLRSAHVVRIVAEAGVAPARAWRGMGALAAPSGELGDSTYPICAWASAARSLRSPNCGIAREPRTFRTSATSRMRCARKRARNSRRARFECPTVTIRAGLVSGPAAASAWCGARCRSRGP